MRAYRDRSDVIAMQALLETCPNPFASYPTATDLAEMFDAVPSHLANHTMVWEDHNREVVGFAIVDPYHNLHFHFRPGYLTLDHEQAMIAWAVECLHPVAQAQGDTITLDAAARDDDAQKVALLRRHHFVPSDTLTLHMARSLTEPFPEPHLPSGFKLRPLAGETEVDAYVATHRAAYGTENMTREGRLAIMRQPHYRPEIDLVATAPDDRLAAFCVCNIDPTRNPRTGLKEGEIGIVGSHPDFRGQGLGRAIVLGGMQVLKEQGMDNAFLTVSSQNTAALHIYKSLGFQTLWGVRWHTKAVK